MSSVAVDSPAAAPGAPGPPAAAPGVPGPPAAAQGVPDPPAAPGPPPVTPGAPGTPAVTPGAPGPPAVAPAAPGPPPVTPGAPGTPAAAPAAPGPPAVTPAAPGPPAVTPAAPGPPAVAPAAPGPPAVTPAAPGPPLRTDALDFTLPPALEAHEPVELDGRRRDDVRLLVATAADRALTHHRLIDLPTLLAPGDVLVVNTSPTLPAAAGARRRVTGEPVLVHFATPAPFTGPAGGVWVVELRRPEVGGNAPLRDAHSGERVDLAGGGGLRLLAPATGMMPDGGVRLWLATVELVGPVEGWLAHHGRPIRYRDTVRPVALDDYQTVLARPGTAGSAEMPSAGRPLSTELVTALVAAGVLLAPLTLHAGVSSLEEGEHPPAERYEVPEATAALVDHVHRRGGRVVAVGTTVVRALETVADTRGRAHPGAGWTELVLGPERPARLVDGLLTGWHEPRSSHLRLLEAVSDRDLLERSYAAALAAGYHWHEFGDLHLLLGGGRWSGRLRRP